MISDKRGIQFCSRPILNQGKQSRNWGKSRNYQINYFPDLEGIQILMLTQKASNLRFYAGSLFTRYHP